MPKFCLCKWPVFCIREFSAWHQMTNFSFLSSVEKPDLKEVRKVATRIRQRWWRRRDNDKTDFTCWVFLISWFKEPEKQMRFLLQLKNKNFRHFFPVCSVTPNFQFEDPCLDISLMYLGFINKKQKTKMKTLQKLRYHSSFQLSCAYVRFILLYLIYHEDLIP